ncbi:hypothetical protein NDS46_16545 [Paenibacillus thiaminolyticus]|uniref:hypothetical protein n=1 Tax=Paenibacillus thiaminolyticus TaxID=49283 RepID=UPI00232DDCE9|nr:hypothetical protein [Paenibacillus thiaminolyticus]WCF05979.1 hypothetical protein NDS46_16545 [Paenibacillus thiaminolyticus]
MTDDYDGLLLDGEGMAKRGSGYPQAAGGSCFHAFSHGSRGWHALSKFAYV